MCCALFMEGTGFFLPGISGHASAKKNSVREPRQLQQLTRLPNATRTASNLLTVLACNLGHPDCGTTFQAVRGAPTGSEICSTDTFADASEPRPEPRVESCPAAPPPRRQRREASQQCRPGAKARPSARRQFRQPT